MTDSTAVNSLRHSAGRAGLRIRKRGEIFELREIDGASAYEGTSVSVQAFIRERLGPRRTVRQPGPLLPVPAAWAPMIDDYLRTLAAAGQPATTMRLRRGQLNKMARELDGDPADVTGEKLVAWFGKKSDWSMETRRSVRSAARGFFLWAYRARRIPVHIADELPRTRQSKASPRPAPDQVWQQALAAADARATLMLRLAAEAGLRRAEVSRVHVRDLTEDVGGYSLLVHGKGNKPRTIPISDSLADLIRVGAAGHTPGASSTGYLFPGQIDGHMSAGHVGKVISRLMPPGWSMHKLRTRFATRVYRGSRNLAAVQALLGHSSIATTERYLACDDDEIRAAMMSAGSEYPPNQVEAEKDSQMNAAIDSTPKTSDGSRLKRDPLTASSAESDEGVRQTHTLQTGGATADIGTTAFEDLIAGWDEHLTCEMTTLAGTRCGRPAAWRINLHGCEQYTMCGQHKSAWLRGARMECADSRTRCDVCGRIFDHLDVAVTVARI